LQPVFKLRTAIGTVNTKTVTCILGMSVELRTATILPASLIIRCKNKVMKESKLWNAPECSARSDNVHIDAYKFRHNFLKTTWQKKTKCTKFVFRRVRKI